LIKFISSIRADGAFFDVGANKGDWSAKVVSSDFRGRLVVVDPLQKNIDHLKVRFKQQSFVTYEKYAVSDTQGEAVFFSNSNDANSGTDSLYDMNEIGYATHLNHTKVSKIRLDELTQDLAIERIHFLKIDVEGHEYSVLRGAERLFSNGLVDFIQIEFGHATRAARIYLHDIVNFLRPFGYSIFVIKPNGVAPLYFTPFAENRYSYINFLLANNGVARELTPIMLRE
jgi:FkbM family methyltransferase